MAGIAHMKTLLINAGGVAAEQAVLWYENLLGHAHAAALASAVGVEVRAQLTSSANLASQLNDWLVVLDARYAAGVHAGPIIDAGNLSQAVGFAGNAVARSQVVGTDSLHGRGARGNAESGFAGSAAGSAVRTAVAAEAALFLADVDARYVAGATATAPGATMANALLACQTVAALATGTASVRVEEAMGHFPTAHWQVATNAMLAAASSFCADHCASSLALLLTQWDARYAAHA
jgi:hypothetical protein